MSDAGDIDLGWETIKGVLAKALMAIVGFGGIFAFTRLIDKNDFGGYYLLLSVVLIAIRPIGGFGQAVRKRWSEGTVPPSQLLGAILAFNVAAIFVIWAGAWMLRSWIRAYVGLPDAWLLCSTLFSTLALFTPFQQILSAMGYPSRQLWNDTLRSVLTLPFQLSLVFSGFGALGMGYGLALATLCCTPIGIYYVRTIPTVPSRATFRTLWEFARYTMVNSLVGRVYTRLDVLLLGIIGTAAVADYRTALQLTLPATFVPEALSTALMPKVSSLMEQEEPVVEDISNALSYASVLAIPIFFGALAISDLIVTNAFGDQYTSAAPFLIGLALYQVISSQISILYQVLLGVNAPKLGLRLNTVSLIFNVILGVMLVIAVGPLGAVVATILAECLRYFLIRRAVTGEVSGVAFIPREILDEILSGCIMYVGVIAANRLTVGGGWGELLLLVGFGGALYITVLVFISSGVRKTAVGIVSK